jgi:hypothetical protein
LAAPPILSQTAPVEAAPIEVSRPKTVKQKSARRDESFEEHINELLEEFINIDWITIGLGLLAFIAVGGLFPYWSYIFSFLSSIQ